MQIKNNDDLIKFCEFRLEELKKEMSENDYHKGMIDAQKIVYNAILGHLKVIELYNT